jgi:hypothetical protein
MAPRAIPYLMSSVGKSLLRITGEILPGEFSAPLLISGVRGTILPFILPS